MEPIVVHCSAGIGRTGVLILMETAACMIEANEPVYPLELVRIMRDQRAMLVQTPVSDSLQKTCNFPFPGPIPICVRIDSKSLSGRTHKTAGRVSEEKLICSSTSHAAINAIHIDPLSTNQYKSTPTAHNSSIIPKSYEILLFSSKITFLLRIF